MTTEEAKSIAYEAICAILSKEEKELNPEMDLVDELGFSSLTYFIMITRIEEKSGVRIPERVARRMETIQDIIDALMK